MDILWSLFSMLLLQLAFLAFFNFILAAGLNKTNNLTIFKTFYIEPISG